MDYLIKCKMYDEFSIYLNSLGIPSVSIEYFNTNYLCIYVKKISEIQVSKELIKQYSNEIIICFKNLLKIYNFEIDFNKYEWTPSSITNVYSKDAHYIDILIRNSKKEILEQIDLKIVSELHPKYIYFHSSNYENGNYPAGYSIVFNNETELRQSEKSVQSKIIDICNETLIKNDIEKRYNPDYLVVKFYDVNNCNLYDMHRED
jgi:hypothetical protein